jgi:SAM-dependent methyltransferase
LSSLGPVTCIVCGESDARAAFIGWDRQHGGPGSFVVRRCSNCGTYSVNPQPDLEALPAYYPADYAPYGQGGASERRWWARWNQQYAIGKLARAATRYTRVPGKALDVGCATGGFLAALRSRGWHVQGVELNAEVAARTQSLTGIDVFAGDLAEARYPDATFDLVTFWDVLEHLPDPRRTLEEAARVCRAGASLVLTVPNPGSLEARLFGPCWAGWDVPRHLWVFPQRALERLLSETGWRVRASGCLRGRQWMLALSLRLWLEERVPSARLRRAALVAANSVVAKVLLLPYFVALERLGLGSIMAIYAEREGS